MEGRWAVTAVEAQRTGSLDYKEISRTDGRSLIKEALILRQIRNSKLRDRRALLFSKIENVEYIKELWDDITRLDSPWEYLEEEKSEKKVLQSSGNRELDKLQALYNYYKENVENK